MCGARSGVPKTRSHPEKSAGIRCRGLFFDAWPTRPHPAANGLFVAFARLPLGTLATPAQLTEHLPDMPNMKRHAELATDDARDALERPEVGLVTGRRRSGEQDCFELTQLVAGQLRLASRTSGARQRLPAAGQPGGMPSTGGLPTDAQLPRHIGLRVPLPKQLGGL